MASHAKERRGEGVNEWGRGKKKKKEKKKEKRMAHKRKNDNILITKTSFKTKNFDSNFKL